jgi:hypothetical protein
VQEHHDLADDLLVGPGTGDLGRALGADAVHLAQPLGLGLDDVEDSLAELLDQALRVDRADAADHARAEVSLDALDRRRRRRPEEARPELLAMGAVVRPFTGGSDPLPGGDRGRVADHRDQVAVAAGLDAEDADAVPRVVVGDPLNEACENLAVAIRAGHACLLRGWSLVLLGAGDRPVRVGHVVMR